MDSFSFGKPAKGRRLRPGRAPKAKRREPSDGPPSDGSPTGGSIGGSRKDESPRVGKPRVARSVLVGGGVALAALLAFGLFKVVKGGGEAVTSNEKTDLKQVDATHDREAQSTVRNALVAAKVAFVDGDTYATVTVQALSAIEPSLRFVPGASTGPEVVSVAASADEVGLAVLSKSGTCFYIHASVSADAFGSGSQCTGQAALSASGGTF